MSNGTKPTDLDVKFQNALRSSTARYTCPACSRSFASWPRAWDHAKEAHQDSPGATHFTEEAEAKKKFMERAQSRASPGQATTDSARPKTSSYNDDPARPNFGGELRLASPNRPSSAPENTQGPGKKIDDIRQLTLGQERATETRDRYGLRYNPKKRQAGGDAATPHSTLGGPNEKTASGGFSVDRDPEFSRQGNPTSNTEYHRDTLDPRKPLWDGNTDNPNTGKPRRRDRQQSSANNPSPHFNIQRVHTYSSKKHDVVKKNGRQRSHDRGQDRAVHNSNFNFNERPQKLLILGKDRPLSSEEPLPVEQRPESPEPEPDMLLQPDTRPISHEQLVVEVKGIYAGLVMVEAKCIDIDERQSAAAQEKALTKRVELKNEQWQSLIALHKQLLHEHHDFFLASQHPSASPALSKLAAKYSMPARMWRHGIHAFLEVLRHRLPSSLEHMLAFIYIAYSMMALLYETVATFEDTWIECLGDLGRYRMAIEDDEPKDREVWSNVARFWYNKAADKSPNVGRLYHHLAILARPYTLEQLSLYTRSLTCVTPFESAKGSIMTLFNPILSGKESATRRSSFFETLFIKAHGILFTKGPLDPSDGFDEIMKELENDSLFDSYITKNAARFKETGVFAAVANIAALFEYGVAKKGVTKPILRLEFESFQDANKVKDEAPQPSSLDSAGSPRDPQPGGPADSEYDGMSANISDSSLEAISLASKIAFFTLRTSLRRGDDVNTYPLVHVYLVFLWSLVSIQKAMKCIESYIPWNDICSFLTVVAAQAPAEDEKFRCKDFPKSEQGVGRPLPEDFILRGQTYSQWYFPETWFTDAMIDDDERSLELPSMAVSRSERLLWLGSRIADADQWIRYDEADKCFLMTDYAKGLQASTSELAPDTRTETLSIDQDSIMTDVDIVDDTPQTRSLAQSESLNASEDSTRPSTPTGVPFGRPAVDSRTPTAIDPNDANDDIQMVDVSPVKDRPAELSSGFSKPSMPSWHPNTNVKTVREEYATDPFKLQKPLDSGDPEVYEPHKLG